MSTIRLTMAQAIARHLAVQQTEIDGVLTPLFGGVWAIFGHGNVAAFGEALYQVRDQLPTFRSHNEQAMTHAAIAFAKTNKRRRMMACTTSIGPGATNMVTAAAVAHVNRLPVLLLPGDVFANRKPEPVLQQVEDFGDGTISANDCFKPVSRYFDRISRPEQIIPALNRALQVLTDPADCGPVTLSICQDVQAEAFDYPAGLFEPKIWRLRRPRPDGNELSIAAEALQTSKAPMIIAGGGVLYSDASEKLKNFAETHNIPVAETQAGKSSIPASSAMNMGSIGVTGTSAANELAEQTDLVLAVGSRLQDFTTGSWSIFKNPHCKIIGLNVQPFDAGKRGAIQLVCDARTGLEELSKSIGDWQSPAEWIEKTNTGKVTWHKAAENAMAPSNAHHPSDAQVIGSVLRSSDENTILVCAAGGLPGELHKLWNSEVPGGYHLEYGYSCMGYEIAGGMGVKLANPERDVVVMVGDGSYLMMNSEIATSIMLGLKLTIVLLDNRGFACINRLQMGTGGANFNNLLKDAKHVALPEVDFRAHAESMGAISVKVEGIADLDRALEDAKSHDRTSVIVIDTDPLVTTEAGGSWWDVAVPEVSDRNEVKEARKLYETGRMQQNLDY